VTTPKSDRPLLRVVKGDPTPEELAALVAVLTARASAAEETSAADRASAHLAYGLRKPVVVGPGAWVASGWVAGTRTKASL
jgi:acyl-CoA carboxylase epsilon subunit